MSYTLLTMTRGDEKVFNVTLHAADTSPLDLAGLDLTFTATRGDIVITKIIGDGITVTDEPGGLASVTIAPADTQDFEERIELTWDLQVADGEDIVTPLEGRLVVTPDVSP